MATGGCASEPRPSLSSLSWGVWVRASRPSSRHSTSANSTVCPGHGFSRGGVCSQGRGPQALLVLGLLGHHDEFQVSHTWAR